MNLVHRLRSLDDSFDRRVDRLAPTETGKERLILAVLAVVVAIIGIARAVSGDSAIAIVLGSLAILLVVAGQLRHQRRQRQWSVSSSE